jgi:hypothetical protein
VLFKRLDSSEHRCRQSQIYKHKGVENPAMDQAGDSAPDFPSEKIIYAMHRIHTRTCNEMPLLFLKME